MALLSLSLPTPGQSAPDLAAFGWGLLRTTSKDTGNACLSPWSAAVALSMARAGAAGTTATEMDTALTMNETQRRSLAATVAGMKPRQIGEWVDGKQRQVDAYELRAANAAWLGLATALRDSYGAALQRDFGAAPQRIDFAAASARVTINRWVETNTKDRIRDLIPDGILQPQTRLVLVNCLYLNAAWAEPFAPSATHPQPFTLADHQRVDVPTMSCVRELSYGETKQAQFVSLPFRGGDLAFVVIVPRDGAALADVAGEFAVDWARLVETARGRRVQLFLPKFTFDTGMELADGLRALGMRAAFDPAQADFSAMTKDDPVYITAVLHKTFVKVDEFATEAAAATGIVMGPTGAAIPRPQPDPVVVRADRPFLFAIQHRSGPLLFVGRVADPR